MRLEGFMPALLTDTPVDQQTAATAQPPRKRWTRDECAAMESVGLDLTRYELVEGDLINKMSKNWPHVAAVALLHGWLLRVFGIGFVVQEGPIDVTPQDNPTNEPEPDIMVLKRPIHEFFSAHPQPTDIHLAVEVADTTLTFDRNTKAALYARAGIIEYWILDIRGRKLIVHRDPQNGAYASVAVYDETESVAPLGAPRQEFPVSTAFQS